MHKGWSIGEHRQTHVLPRSPLKVKVLWSGRVEHTYIQQCECVCMMSGLHLSSVLLLVSNLPSLSGFCTKTPQHLTLKTLVCVKSRQLIWPEGMDIFKWLGIQIFQVKVPYPMFFLIFANCNFKFGTLNIGCPNWDSCTSVVVGSSH